MGHLEVRDDTTSVILTMSGEIDMAAVHSAAPQLDRLLEAPPERLEVELSGVTFIDSSGVGALVKLYQRTTGEGNQMTLVSPTQPVLRVLRICGLDEVFDVDPALQVDGQESPER